MFRVSTTYNEKVAIQNTSINISGTIWANCTWYF
jgi:hypothetical protein